MQRYFPARWSVLNWVFTIFVGYIAFIMVPVTMIEIIREEGFGGSNGVWALLVGFVPLLMLVSALYAPWGYMITDSEMRVRRLGRNITIPLSDIRHVGILSRRDLGLPIRYLGVGGFLGWYGKFWSSQKGFMNVYITHTRHLVLIETHQGQTFLISPYPSDQFVEYFNTVTDGALSETVSHRAKVSTAETH